MNYNGMRPEESGREQAEQLERIGREILTLCRDELYFSMRFMDVALSSFVYVMDPEARPFGTDGYRMYFHPGRLGGMYRENRILVNRAYLHMVLHCIFRHLTKQGMEERYWNLSCDIAAEHIIDGCNLRPVRYSRSLLRRETYRKLEKEEHVLNAEWIFRQLTEWDLSEKSSPCWKKNSMWMTTDTGLIRRRSVRRIRKWSANGKRSMRRWRRIWRRFQKRRQREKAVS